MESINSVIFYISLAIALCSPNVSTFCGNDEQIEDLKTALLKEETISIGLTTLSVIPVTGATMAFAQILTSGRFALNMKEVFEEMINSLDKNHKNYLPCSEILETTIGTTTVIKSSNFAYALSALIPGVGWIFLPTRLGTSITAMLLLRHRLEKWQNADCQYATTRDCNLKVN